MRPSLRILPALALCWSASLAAQARLDFPLKDNSVRFLVLGDAGTGDEGQYTTARTIIRAGQQFPFTFAIMLGDNIYGRERPQDFEKKFVRPYKHLLDSDVEFHAADLGSLMASGRPARPPRTAGRPSQTPTE